MNEPVVYLDNAATTSVRPEVREAMIPYLWEEFGNPSSPHRFGRAARAAVEDARRRVAAALGAEPNDVLFTSGGTEADNLAVIGAALAARAQGGPFRVAVSAIEHKAVLEAALAVEQMGGEAIILPVDAAGAVDDAAVDQALEAGVAVLCAMWVNNEIGIIQSVDELAHRCATAGTPFHTDAVQAIGKVPCSFAEVPATFLAISGHKIGTPKGIGALIARDRRLLHPLQHGGGQQHGVRPGTENVSGIVGLAVAVELAVSEQHEAAAHTRSLRDDLERRLQEAIPDLRINGVDGRRAPHLSNLSFPGTDTGSLIMHLDLAGICCSSGAACNTGSLSPSHVLTAIGLPVDLAIGAIRFSFSAHNTREDVDLVIEKMPEIVRKVRQMSEVWEG